MKKNFKFILIGIIIILLIVIFIMLFKEDDKTKYQDKSAFLSEVKEIYKTAKIQYTSGIKYIAKVNNNSCDNDIVTDLEYDNNFKISCEGKING